MKKFCIVLMFMSLFGGNIMAQVTYTSADYAVPGDTFIISTATLPRRGGPVFETTGANFNWNFSTLTYATQYLDQYLAPDSTGYQPSYDSACEALGGTLSSCSALWYGLTNIAHATDSIGFGRGEEIRNIYNLEFESPNYLTQSLLGATIATATVTQPFTISYTAPDTIFRFPLAYTNADSCTSSYIFNLNNIGINLVYKTTVKRVNYVDGWGSLTTPYKTFPSVIRLKTTLTTEDSIVYDGRGIPPRPTVTVLYQWFDPAHQRTVFLAEGDSTAGRGGRRGGPGGVTYTYVEYIDTLHCLPATPTFTSAPAEPTLNGNNQAVVRFTNRTPNVNDYNYTWYFGDSTGGVPNTSTAINPTHTYTAAGTYTVLLIACTKLCSPEVCDTFSATVTVITANTVIANFTYTPADPCAGQTVRFRNESLHARTYFWNFGDGTNSVNTNPTHRYTTAGTYTVTLYAYGTGAAFDSIKETITVAAGAPVVTITPSGPTSFCKGDSIVLTASGGNFYEWSTLNVTPSITVKAAATYKVTATNACGSATASITITILPDSVPSITVTPSANGICPGTAVTFTATPSDGGTAPAYQWSINGANVGTNNAVYTSGANLQNGSVVKCLLTSNAGCTAPDTASASVTMIVSTSITPSVTIASNPPGPSYCSGPITFSANTIGGGTSPSYQWSVNGTPVSSTGTFSSSVLTNGEVLNVTMTSNSSCANPTTASTTDTLTINLPVATTINAGICPGQNYEGDTVGGTYIDTFAAADGCDSIRTLVLTVLPNVRDTISASICRGQNYAGHTATGTYVDTFAAFNGCDSIRVVNLTVNPDLTPSVTINPSSNGICPGTIVTFIAQPVDGGNASYSWEWNGSPVGGNSSIYVSGADLQNGDVISVVMTSTLACTVPDSATNSVTMVVANSVTTSVSIVSDPPAPYCQGTTVVFTPNALGGGNTPGYTWKLNGSNVSSTDSFVSSTLSNGDVLSLSMNSSSECATPEIANTSETITILPLAITNITSNICFGDTLAGYSKSGTYVDTFAAVNGCDSIRTLHLTVIQWLNTTVDTTICEGNFYAGYELTGNYVDTFTAVTTGCDSVRMLNLTVNPTSATNSNVSICQGASYEGYDTTAVYIDTIVGGSADGCDSINFLELTVNPVPSVPVITVESGNVFTVTDSSTNISSYQWIINGTLEPGDDSSTYYYTGDSNYTIGVVVIDSNGCQNVGKYTTTGITNVESLTGIKLFPNPTNGKVTVTLPSIKGGVYEVEVWNMTGEGIEPVMTTTNATTEIDLNPFSQGLYLIRVTQGLQSWTGTVSKE